MALPSWRPLSPPLVGLWLRSSVPRCRLWSCPLPCFSCPLPCFSCPLAVLLVPLAVRPVGLAVLLVPLGRASRAPCRGRRWTSGGRLEPTYEHRQRMADRPPPVTAPAITSATKPAAAAAFWRGCMGVLLVCAKFPYPSSPGRGAIARSGIVHGAMAVLDCGATMFGVDHRSSGPDRFPRTSLCPARKPPGR